jgi:hypothetical protein
MEKLFKTRQGKGFWLAIRFLASSKPGKNGPNGHDALSILAPD